MRRGFLLAAISIIIGEALPVPIRGAPILSDGFESGNLGAWTSADANWTIITSSLAAHSGTKGLDVKGNTDPDSDILRIMTPSAGFQSLSWQYWFKVRDGLESADSVVAEWTANGADWLALASYSNLPSGDWQFASFALPETADENQNLGFRFRANLGSATDRMNFDDIALSGTASVPEPGSAILFGCFALSLLRRRRA